MKSIKKLWKPFIILTIMLIVPASSYAIVDLSAYGGYSFAGELKDNTSSSDIDGWQYGFYAHLNSGIPMLFTVGIGGFYQIAPMTLKTDTEDVDATKKTVGFDGYAQLDLPFLPVFPYVRLGIAAKEEVEVKYPGGTWSVSENFKSHYYGFGASYTLLDVVVWDLQLFAEYLYTTSKQENDIKVTGNAINVGLKISL